MRRNRIGKVILSCLGAALLSGCVTARYDMTAVSVPNSEGEWILFRLDRTTGKIWRYDNPKGYLGVSDGKATAMGGKWVPLKETP